MVICDANIVLRYLLQDNEQLSKQATLIIENQDVFVMTEVVAEIVYVLHRVYQMPRKDIAQELVLLFSQGLLFHENTKFILQALDIYANKNFDFVDCVLASYLINYQYEIHTFDKKLQNYLIKL